MIFSFGASGQIIFERLLQSTGKTTLSMYSQLAGAVINIILDPLLLFGYCGFPAMGVRGAAIATVFGQIVAMFMAIHLNMTMNREIHFTLADLESDAGMIARIYRIGAPAIVMQTLNSLQAFGVNFILIRISPTAVAAFGVYIRVQNFVFMPAFGLGNGVIALTAFNYGARNRKRINDAIRYGITYAAIIMVAGMILIQVFANPILRLFDAAAELHPIGAVALRVISLSYLFVAFPLIAQGVYPPPGQWSVLPAHHPDAGGRGAAACLVSFRFVPASRSDMVGLYAGRGRFRRSGGLVAPAHFCRESIAPLMFSQKVAAFSLRVLLGRVHARKRGREANHFGKGPG